ncbi:MAG TPA: CheR family methyltransferase, partial [Acidobacteriota bacterium]|nr:CheR family methyltransferase [Acidobacteriota bacterium]
RKLFRAWSCACARGEESYSLSALWEHWAAQFIPQEARPVDLKITASEMDAEALSRARAAEYDASELQGVPPFAAGSFERRGDRVAVQPRVKKRVRFVCENVLAPARRPRADLILCRNFLIFLDRGGRSAMMEVFRRSLVPGGFLVLGRAETITESAHSAFVAVDAVHRIYRKVEDGVRLK